MRSLNLFSVVLIIWCNLSIHAQHKSITIAFIPSYGTTPLYLSDSVYKSNDSQKTEIETCKFYISNIRFKQKDRLVFRDMRSAYLLDIAVPHSLNLVIDVEDAIVYDTILFDLGIDSITNVSGALGGDLDPTKGMYWTWQSGYINFKLEGKSNLSKSRNNEFQFHLGGYMQPYYSLQTISLIGKSQLSIDINFDIKKIVTQIDCAKQHHIMSPSSEAVRLSKIVADSFNSIEN